MSSERYVVHARGHHGYPQPEDRYEKVVYRNYCVRCGRHGSQVSPFRVRRVGAAAHSHFLQLNWVFDVFFVLPDVGARILAAGISGGALGPVLDHKTGTETSERRQLLITSVLACADTARLPVVTCRPQNEEAAFELKGGKKRYSPETPYCGGVKHHPPTSLALESPLGADAPDLLQTSEWFGSGGNAFRLTLASRRFVELVQKMGCRGLAFKPVRTSGHSERAT